MEKVHDVIIIGAGPAGMNAAIYANRAGLEVLMLEKGAPGGQMINTSEIENYIGLNKITGPELSLKMFNHTQQLGVEYKYGDVTEVQDGDIKTIVTTDGTYKTKAVIIATGTKPKLLNIENENKFAGRGISWCAICDGPLYKGKDVIVIGGGNSAIEEAIYLSGLANKVTVLVRKKLRAAKAYIDVLNSKKNVEIKLNTSVVEFIGQDNIEGAIIVDNETKEKSKIQFAATFIFIGYNPKTEIVRNLNITSDNSYITVDENMKTTVAGIFACGDVVDKKIRQISTATADASIAAINVVKYLEKIQ